MQPIAQPSSASLVHSLCPNTLRADACESMVLRVDSESHPVAGQTRPEAYESAGMQDALGWQAHLAQELVIEALPV